MQLLCIHLFCKHLILFLGDGPELRDYVIKNGCVEPLLQLVQPETPVSRQLCRAHEPSTSVRSCKCERCDTSRTVVLTFYSPMSGATEFSYWVTTDRDWVSVNTNG